MKSDTLDLDALRPYATLRQLEYIEAIEAAGGSVRAAAAALGVSRGSIRSALDTLKKKAAVGLNDPKQFLPDGMVMKGVSLLVNKDGALTQQWIKGTADVNRQRELYEAALASMAETLPRLPAVAAPGHTEADLATVYTLTDSHVGAMCWKEEGGEDWNLEIAERTLVGCFARMVAAAPASRKGIVAQLGDFLHADGILPLTPTSGHVLDADGRFALAVRVAVRVLRRVVDLALQKHEVVVLVLMEGNHDISSSIWMRAMFAALYENEPRVQVLTSPSPYVAIQHGETMLAWHHGHLKKKEHLPLLFATQFPTIWGTTTNRYAHCGHQHHSDEKEHSGMTVIQHPTLAARDAHSSRHGYHSLRVAQAITYHREFGQVERNIVRPGMVTLA